MTLKEYLQHLKANGNPLSDQEIADSVKDIYDSSTRFPEKPDLGENVSYERMEYDVLSDDEINENAKNSLKEYENSSIKAIEDGIDGLNKKYESDKVTNTENYEKGKSETQDAYEKARQTTSDDMLKRGLARSSIAVEKVSSLNKSEAEALAGQAEKYQNEINAIDSEINALESKRQDALNDFNIAYTVKLTNEINSLKAERNEKETAALKYNNSLAEKEYQEKIKKAEAESSLYTEALNQKTKENAIEKDVSSKAQNEIYRQVYELLRANLEAMSIPEAKKAILENPIYKNNLSTAYYYKLYDEFGR